MVMKIRKLVDSIYEKQELLRKSEFKALQAQINPHFLYNSLDSIIWLLRMERTDEAIVILQNLIVLFRIFLSKGHEVIPVRQEVRHLDSYLQIQSMRYSRKFTYTVDVPEEYKDFYTLKLILQPLVENSIYHGMSAEHGSIHIHISLIMGKDTLTFRVEDTGQGMSERAAGKTAGKYSGAGKKGRRCAYFFRKRGRLWTARMLMRELRFILEPSMD